MTAKKLKEVEPAAVLSFLPSVDAVLSSPRGDKLCARYPRWLIKEEVVSVLDELRREALGGGRAGVRSREAAVTYVLQETQRRMVKLFRPSLGRVINATGIVLHTGLGRAPLAAEARKSILTATEHYCNLELDLETGKRGDRQLHVERLLRRLSGAEAACVVNNNAAAVLVALNTMAYGKEAIISRGQLVEIGGSFRMPEVMEKSGTIMVEVGTTNKTKLSDYERAISERTGVVVVVHTSNYRVLGFTAEPALREVVDMAHAHHVPVLHDLGGGVLVDLRSIGLPYEPLVQESVQAGVDVVTFSGDKVLGGPQAGVIVGRRAYVEAIKTNPLMRAVRCDKLTIGALEATLKLFLDRDRLLAANPTLRMLSTPVEVVEQRARRVVDLVAASCERRCHVRVAPSNAQAGSGALPLEQIPSRAVVVRCQDLAAHELAARLRRLPLPVIGYVQGEELYLDMRTVRDDEVPLLAAALRKVMRRAK
ncbi:MAG: L-seryl-tRNA(Sec) selenium transferase [candidate division KSB1 bacterium]|nr:L-seryl-tRNA(Sec) selenium transferase [candidate division KSB1 bacterium]MDZ7295316.1 L-seryl-tRNA(Sec) selenium transferase [candidate division KSB1 bacterium]MDZ7393227.1 L-seryl-tRNA(Sec) selenium transferase [candidate division KSB1 bacterium]